MHSGRNRGSIFSFLYTAKAVISMRSKIVFKAKYTNKYLCPVKMNTPYIFNVHVCKRSPFEIVMVSNPTCLLHRTLDLVLVAGDGHEVGPIGGLDDHAGDVRARDVEGGGAVLVGALDAGAGVGLVAAGVAVHALLQERTEKRTRTRSDRRSGSVGDVRVSFERFVHKRTACTHTRSHARTHARTLTRSMSQGML